VILGFSSIYREGFEVVLFLQALVLEAGIGIVLAGTAVGLIIVVVVGLITFRLQVHLPYRNMLIITGILIGVVLLQMVGKTVYVLQVVGWMPIHPLSGISLPYWWGTWFGVYPTWEGIILQSLAAGFVISSYYLAEWMRQRNRLVTAQSM
jgi:high-affinity iron transporter